MNELTTKQTNLTTNTNAGISAEDIQIPGIILVQKMTKVVDSHNAKPGEIWDMLENKPLGNETEPLEFIPLLMTKEIGIFDTTQDTKGVFLKTIPYQQNHPMFWEEDGKKYKAVTYMNWLVLPTKKLEKGNTIPHRLSFKSSSYNTGKALATQALLSQQNGTPLHGRTYLLTTAKKTNDLGSFHVYEINQGRDTRPEELEKALFWVQKLGGIQNEVADATDEEVPF